MAKRKKLSIKRKRNLMYKDGPLGGKGFLSGLLTFVFVASLIAFLVTAFLYLLAVVLWPLLYIILVIATLGIILASPDINIDAFGFAEGLAPVLWTCLIIAVVAFVLKFVIDWLYILNGSRVLKKDPEANKHYIAIAKVTKRLKIVDLVVFAVQVLVIVVMVATTSTTAAATDGETGNQVLSWIYLLLFIAAPIVGSILAKVWFNKIDEDVQAVYTERLEKKLELKARKKNKKSKQQPETPPSE